MMALDFIDVFCGDREFDNFGAKLFQLIAKADSANLARLAMAYPREVSLYRWWMKQKERPTREAITAYAQAMVDFPPPLMPDPDLEAL